MNNQVDVHPEDLLDRESAGKLSIDQRKRLDQHTSRCASCATLRTMSAWLRLRMMKRWVTGGRK